MDHQVDFGQPVSEFEARNSHPQEWELREKLRKFLDDSPIRVREGRGLTVLEPESGAEICYIYGYNDNRRYVLSPFITFSWTAEGERERGLAIRLGVREPRSVEEEVINPFTGKPMKLRARIPVAEREVSGIEDALRVGLTILREVKEVSDDSWLWITDDYDMLDYYSQMVELGEGERVPPRPAVWPPEAAEPGG